MISKFFFYKFIENGQYICKSLATKESDQIFLPQRIIKNYLKKSALICTGGAELPSKIKVIILIL